MPPAVSIPSGIDSFILILQALGVIVPLVIIGVGAFIVWKKKWLVRWKIKVVDVELFDGRKRIRYRKARRIKKRNDKGGENKLEFDDGEIWSPPAYKDLLLDDKGKGWLFLQTPIKGQHQIMTVKEIGGKTILEAKKLDNMNFWKETEDAKADLRWTQKDWIDKLYPILAIVMVAIAALILFFGTFQYGIFPLLDRADAYGARTEVMLDLSTQMLDKAVQYLELLNASSGVVVPYAPIPTNTT